jgi:putative ABC transport system permease protein
MMEMTAMFAGILSRASSTVTNIPAAMWVMDPAVNVPGGPIPMPDYVLDAVRSMDGVSYAVPLFVGGATLKLKDGVYQSVNVVGLDDETLFGRPAKSNKGNIQDIFNDNSFSGRSTTPSSRSWKTRRSARRSSSMTIAARSSALPGSCRTD